MNGIRSRLHDVGVAFVTVFDGGFEGCGIDRFAASGEFGATATGSFRDRHIEEYFERGFGKYNRTNVPTNHDHIPTHPDGALLCTHDDAYRWVPGGARHCAFDPLIADIPGDVAVVNGNGVLSAIGYGRRVDPDADAFCTRSHRYGIAGIDTGFDDRQGQCAIHDPRIKVDEPQRCSQRCTEGAFAGTGGAIDGDCTWMRHSSSIQIRYSSDYTVLCSTRVSGNFIVHASDWVAMDRLWRRNQWLVLLAGALIIGILLRAHALYRWDGVAMQHPDERFLVYTAYFLAVPSDFGAYLTACPQGDPDKTDTPEAKHFRSQPLPSLACNTLNPRNQDWSRVFVYGTLPTTVMRVVSSALYGQDAQPLQIRNVGRTLSLSADVLSILMLFFLARGVMNRPLAATVALLYALLPLPIQLSHFATVDAMAGPCIIGALALLVRWERLRWPGWIGLAVCIGLACAIRSTNVSIWLLLPLVWLVRWQKPTWAQFSRVVGSGVLSIIVLWLADPTIWNGWWFDARWLHDVLLAGRLVNGMVDTPPTFQWSWQTPYIYPLSQMALWGMGLVVCSAGVAGWLLQCYRPRQRLWPVWLWVTAFVLWQGAVFGMTMRYYLPIYGAVCLLAVQVLPLLRRRWQRWLAATMVATTALLALGWSGLYATEHPRISASRWMYANIPSGSNIAVEVWDDVLPLTLSSTAKPNRYTTLPLDVFAPDRPHKYMTQPGEAPGLIEQLDRAEYVVLSSARGYGVLRHMPARFPIIQRYYAALFDGSLGFTMVHHAARWPHIGPWRWDTRGAEEALSVYDHPQVHIFAKTATYTHDRAVA
ncbi:MAG: hypothetical protein RLY87_147, partial [Chloroflexota bacterium]